MSRQVLAIVTGHRDGFNPEHASNAQAELPAIFASLGYDTICMREDSTPYGGAIKTQAEGAACGKWLQSKRGQYAGVWFNLPNFSDERAVTPALKDLNVPVFVHAWADNPDDLSMQARRDALCGKFNITATLQKSGIGFVLDDPFTVTPGTPEFAANVEYFATVCRVHNALRDLHVGAIGALTTPFMDLQFDPKALVAMGMTVESFDLATVFKLVNECNTDSLAYRDRADELRAYANWDRVPVEAFGNLVKLSLAISKLIEDYQLTAIAPRCWTEMQEVLGISPCVLLGWFNDQGITASCEVDVMNAMVGAALSAASGQVSTILDWNNTWRTPNTLNVFHCGQTASSLMREPGTVQEHEILSTVTGSPGWGPCVGHILPGPYTYGSAQTYNGDVFAYLGNGAITPEEITGFFGCRGILEIDKLQQVLRMIASNGFEHHFAMTPSSVKKAVAAGMRMRGIKIIDADKVGDDGEDD